LPDSVTHGVTDAFANGFNFTDADAIGDCLT
jgi:hypothetical protein